MKFQNELLKDYIAADIIKENEVTSVLQKVDETSLPLFQILLKYFEKDEATIYKFLQKKYNLPFIKVNNDSLDNALLHEFNEYFIIDRRIIPYKEIAEGHIICLIDTPYSLIYVPALSYFRDSQFECQLIAKSNMDELIDVISNKTRREKAIAEFNTQEKKKTSHINKSSLDDFIDAPTVQLADTLLEEAIDQNASDIHIEPMEEDVRVRFRLDGVLSEHMRIISAMFPSLLSRYKIMAGIDISERRIPQDGKIVKRINGQSYDFRVSTIPTIFGEKMVIRVFATSFADHNIKDIASDPTEEKKIQEMIQSPHGIILLTGPTGSGKTTTLYTFLKELNKGGTNIISVEDPVENQIAGINQVQVNYKVGLEFATALRSILRQDPNIIMIGEIRDEETAHIAVQAAITGHLVLSTVHTNDAITTITRLIDMKVEPYLVSDSLIGAISQRLVRKLCPLCKKVHAVTKEESEFLYITEGTKIYEPCGCDACNHTGYKGRIATFEILQMNDKIREAIDDEHLNIEKIRDACYENHFVDLAQAASRLVLDGTISVAEFKSIINISDILKRRKDKTDYGRQEINKENIVDEK